LTYLGTDRGAGEFFGLIGAILGAVFGILGSLRLRASTVAAAALPLILLLIWIF
jgi:hypothetical protein